MKEGRQFLLQTNPPLLLRVAWFKNPLFCNFFFFFSFSFVLSVFWISTPFFWIVASRCWRSKSVAVTSRSQTAYSWLPNKSIRPWAFGQGRQGPKAYAPERWRVRPQASGSESVHCEWLKQTLIGLGPPAIVSVPWLWKVLARPTPRAVRTSFLCQNAHVRVWDEWTDKGSGGGCYMPGQGPWGCTCSQKIDALLWRRFPDIRFFNYFLSKTSRCTRSSFNEEKTSSIPRQIIFL